MDLTGVNLTEDGSQVFGKVNTEKIIISATGTWGTGTLTLGIYNESLEAYLPVAAYTEDTYATFTVGRGAKLNVTLADATDPDLDIGIFEVRG